MLEILISTDEVCEMVKISPTDTAKHLMSYGLDILGSGVSRDVYALSDRLVLKVRNDNCPYEMHSEANRNEVALWEDLSEEEREQGTFAKIYAWSEDYEWLIMERISEIGHGWHDRTEEDRDLMSRYGVGDMHDENYGARHDGTFAVIDYALNTEALDGDFGHCSCFNCTCQRCWPDGCECETFDGCHYRSHKCEVCSGYRRSAYRLANDSRLPTIARNKARDVANGLADNYACTRADVVWEGCTTAEEAMVCRECADKLRFVGPDLDMAQGILEFPNRYAVGFETKRIRTLGAYVVRNGKRTWCDGRMVTVIAWFVRDRLISDVVGYNRPADRSHFGRPIGEVNERCFGAIGFERATMLCEILNNGYNGCTSANRIARI